MKGNMAGLIDELTFDQAQDNFREFPSQRTAALYAATAAEYFLDEMIGPDTFNAAINEIACSHIDS